MGQTDGQTDRRTDGRARCIMRPIYDGRLITGATVSSAGLQTTGVWATRRLGDRFFI